MEKSKKAKVRQTQYKDDKSEKEYEIIRRLCSCGGSNIDALDGTVELLNRGVEEGIFNKKYIGETVGKLGKAINNIKSAVSEYNNLFGNNIFSIEALYDLGGGGEVRVFSFKDAIERIKDGINADIILEEELEKALEDYDQKHMAFVEKARKARYYRTDDNERRIERAVERELITADEGKELVEKMCYCCPLNHGIF